MSRTPVYRANKYPGNCERCGQTVPAGQGRLRRAGNRRWVTSHLPTRWHGSPISGRWVDGCPPAPEQPTDPDTDETTAPDPPPLTAEQAYTILWQRFTGSQDPPPRQRKPGHQQGRDQLDADTLRLALMDPIAMAHDGEAMATFLEIVDHHRWDG